MLLIQMWMVAGTPNAKVELRAIRVSTMMPYAMTAG
jgi:hypothetical protein